MPNSDKKIDEEEERIAEYNSQKLSDFNDFISEFGRLHYGFNDKWRNKLICAYADKLAQENPFPSQGS